jgi:hypothetical protein
MMNDQEKIPESIRKAGKSLPFKVPESYFEDLQDRIMDRLAEKETPVRRLNTFRSRLALAAMFIGLIAIGVTTFTLIRSNTGTMMLSEEEIDETLEYFAWELDNSMLADAVMESELFLTSESTESSSEDIIQYLSEDEIDFSSLYIE